ncbi:integrase [Lysinibacillus fusiformis]|uniref:integrase n=1 Tax=Lysinibacillus fusiformis TaxID=28031 RepID=UPI001E29DDA1|nr:integrase [Lysinibacillus fusiformis]MCE4042796.1 integrase [Lysinibacillus fusiformis]
MTKQLKEKELYEIINSVVQAVGMTMTIKQDHSGVNMSYNFIGDYVGFDADRLIEAKNELQYPLSLEMYVKTMTLHELGHAVDREALQTSLPRTIEIFTMKKQHTLQEIYLHEHLLKMLLEEHDMNIQFEQTAWENAWALNRKHHFVCDEDFDYIKQHSLATYKKIYEQDLQAYHHLLNQPVPQLA